jgi:hypothetical protein
MTYFSPWVPFMACCLPFMIVGNVVSAPPGRRVIEKGKPKAKAKAKAKAEPKAEAKASSKAKAKAKAQAAQPEEVILLNCDTERPEGVDPRDLSNYVTQMKAKEKNNGPWLAGQQEAWNMYKGLSRFSPMKAQMVAAWKNDKTMTKYYVSTKTVESETKTEKQTLLHGFGTEFFG